MTSARTPATTPDGERPRIVVAVDGSDCSKQALRWAARIAPGLDARIEAVTVWDFGSTYGWSSLPPLSPPHPAIEKELIAAVDETFGADRPLDLTLRVLEGATAEALIAFSRDALMLVVGSRGRGGMLGGLLGSVSSTVAEHAHCPVLVVHPPRHEPPS